MTFDKALKILGLNQNFTEDELKQAHRKLAQLHHPDRHEKSEDREKEEEIMKDINAAKDYLMKYLKMFQNHYTRNTNQSSTNEKKYREAEIYYQEKLDELSDIAKFDFNKHKVSNKIKEVIDAIKNIVHYYSIHTKDKKEKETVHKQYEMYLNMIKYRFKELTAKFYEENAIDKNDVKETINYDCTLEELYEQLLKIRYKYSKETLLKKKLEAEILKYTYFAGYEAIEKQIKSVVNDFVNKIKNKEFKYSQKDIDDMHQKISKLFNQFFFLKQRIENLEKIVQTINDEKIKEQYESIKNTLYSEYSFYSFSKEISNLEELINKYQKENQIKIRFKENESAINEIYKELISRYSKVAQSFNIIVHPEIIDEINKQLNALIQLFQEGCKKFKDLDFFNLFNEITFKSIVDDDKITKKIRNELKEKSSKIYIKINIERIWDEYSFFWFDEENMIMYRINNLDGVYSEKISYEQIDKDYISLEEFLDEANFIGEQRMKSNATSVGLVYERFGYSLYWEKDKFRINKDIALIKTSDRKHEYLNRFRDKKYVYDMIEEQLKEIIEKHKKRETTSYGDNFNFIDIDNISIKRKKEYNYDDPYGYSGRKWKK